MKMIYLKGILLVLQHLEEKLEPIEKIPGEFLECINSIK
jgi:hypothetical protein